MVGEFVAHDSSPQFGSLNHGSPAKRNAPGPLLVRRLRTGADINQSSISAKCAKMTLGGHTFASVPSLVPHFQHLGAYLHKAFRFLIAALLCSASSAEAAGIQLFNHGPKLTGAIWYPCEAKPKDVELGDLGVGAIMVSSA
jgi:hypothetical protein